MAFPSFNPQVVQVNSIPQFGPTLAQLMQSATQYVRYQNAAARAAGAGTPKAQMLATVADPSAPNGVRQVALYGKTEKERTVELNRILGNQALAVLQNDEAVQKKLAQLEGSSVGKQEEILADIRKHDMPRLQKAAGDAAGSLFPEMLKGYDKSIAEQRKAIEQDSGWKALKATAGTEAARVGEALLNVFRSDEERLASAERINAMRQKDLEDNAYLRDQALRAQEGEGTLSRTFSGDSSALTNIGNAAIETLGFMGGPLAAGAAGAAIGGPVGAAVGLLGGAALTSPQTAQTFYERVASDENKSQEQKLAAITEGANAAMATGAAVGALGPVLGKGANTLLGAMAGRVAPRVVSRIPTTRGLRAYAFRDVPRSAVDIAAFSGADVLGGNAVYNYATGENTPITQGLSEAMSGAVLSAPFFGVLGARRRETQRAYNARMKLQNDMAMARASALEELPNDQARTEFNNRWAGMTQEERRRWYDDFIVQQSRKAEAERAARQKQIPATNTVPAAEVTTATNTTPASKVAAAEKALIYANPHLEAFDRVLHSGDKDRMDKWTAEQRLERTPTAMSEIRESLKDYLSKPGTSLDDIKRVIEHGGKGKEKLAALAKKDGMYTSKKLSTTVRNALKELIESDEIVQFAANVKAANESIASSLDTAVTTLQTANKDLSTVSPEAVRAIDALIRDVGEGQANTAIERLSPFLANTKNEESPFMVQLQTMLKSRDTNADAKVNADANAETAKIKQTLETASGEQTQRESGGGTQPPAVVELNGQARESSASAADIASNRGDETATGTDAATVTRGAAAEVAGSDRANESRGSGGEQVQSIRPDEVSEATTGRSGIDAKQPETVSGRPAAEPAGREGNTGERVEERASDRESNRETVGETDRASEQPDVRTVEEESITVLPDGTKVQDDIPADMPLENILSETKQAVDTVTGVKTSKDNTINPLKATMSRWLKSRDIPIENLRTAMNSEASMSDTQVMKQAQHLLTKQAVGDTLSKNEKEQLKALNALGMKVKRGSLKAPINPTYATTVNNLLRFASPEIWAKLDPSLKKQFSLADIYEATGFTSYRYKENRSPELTDALYKLAERTFRKNVELSLSDKINATRSKLTKLGILPLDIPAGFDTAFKQSGMKDKTEFAISMLNPAEAKQRTAERPRC